MPVNVNFTTGSAPKPMGGSFQIRSTSNGPILNDSQFNLNPQSLDLARQSVRMRHTEGMPLPNLNASNVLAGNSVTNAYQTIPGLAPLLQDPNVAVRPGEEMTDFLNPHLVRGFPEVQRLDHSPMSSTAGLPAPEQEACGNSWGSYDFIDEFPQANGGPDINLAYFFNEHEWERH